MSGYITLAEAKVQVSVDHDEHDSLITGMISAGAGHIEDTTGFVCPKREDEPFVFDRFGRELVLPLRPVDADTIVVSYLDGDGAPQTFAEFRTYERNGLLRIAPGIGHSWPSVPCARGVITVTADVGWPAATAETPVPCQATLKRASLLCVGTWYANREGVVVGTIVNTLPDGFAALLEAERLRKV
jgi:uncharacterized phiE125 gp8 family phage protein